MEGKILSKEVSHYITSKALLERRRRLMKIKFMSMLDDAGK